MSFFDPIKEKLGEVFAQVLDFVKRKAFGSNNERLDFVMDSFYKLSPSHQTGVLIAAGGAVFFIVILIFATYFSIIGSLEKELSNGYAALQEIRTLSTEMQQEKERLDWLARDIDRKTSGFRPKPFFENVANKVGVNIESLRSEESAISEDSYLSKRFRYVNVDFRLPKVSIPRLLKFISEVEKSRKGLVINTLQIRARYGDRLFFDTQAKFSGFKSGSKR